MADALNIINYIFTKFIDLLFNRFELFPNVTLGWIAVIIVIFSIMISNIINIARSNIQVERRDSEDGE